MPVLVRPDGVGLYHELHGPEDADPVILLEGMGGDIPGWRRNIPHLARELRVIAYDFRGNGHSDEPPGECTMETFVDDTIALLDHLEVRRAHVYGQSFGGMVAEDLALGAPQRVRTLILGCTHMGPARAVPSRAKAPKGEPWRAMYAPAFSPIGTRTTSPRTSGSAPSSRLIPKEDGDNGRRCRRSTRSTGCRRSGCPRW